METTITASDDNIITAAATPRSNIGWTILAIISTLFALALIVPLAPHFPDAFDAETSWMLAMHAGWTSHVQFGSDRIFTYGPYGCFCLPEFYYPATYPLLLAVRTAITVIMLWAMWSLMPALRRVVNSPAAAALWLFALLGIVTASDDVLIPMCSVLLLVTYYCVDGGRLSARSILLLALMAMAGLAKFTWLTINTVLVILLAIDQLLRRRSLTFWIPGLYFAFIAALWLLAKQRPAGFIDFIRYSAELGSGYTEAMTSIRGEIAEAAEFVVAGALLLLLIADSEWRRRGSRGLIHAVAIAFVLFAVFKQSFVRHDELHSFVAPFILLATALLYGAVIWPTLQRTSHRVMWILALGLALMNASAAVAHRNAYGLAGAYGRSIHNASWSIAGAMHLLHGDRELKSRYASALAEIRAAEPLPSMIGSTDVYPNSQSVALAYGVDYRPRPIFQSYAAYTPNLAALNLEYIRSDKAPDNILFDVATIDARLPSLDDGLSWPELLTRYDVVGLYDTTALLRRAPAPRAFALTPLTNITARLSEPISVPTIDAGPIWAEIDVKLSQRGKLANLLYRPPALLIEVQMEGAEAGAGRTETFRFIAPIARAGFLISPLVVTRGQFVSFASTSWKQDLKTRSVRSILIAPVSLEKFGDASSYFDPAIVVKLSRLEFARQDLTAITGWNKRFATPDSGPKSDERHAAN